MFSALPLVLALSFAVARPAGDAETAARLAGAAARFDAEAFSGSYVKTTRTQVISGGAVLLDEMETVRVVVRNGRRSSELLSATAGGRDVTSEKLPSAAPEPGAAPAPAFAPPGGLSFRPLTLGGSACGAAFGAALASDPAAAGPMPEGKLAWDCSSGTPLWAEFRPTDAPSELAEPRARLEFARAGDLLYAARYTLEGRIADGGETVTMRLVQEISDLRPLSARQ